MTKQDIVNSLTQSAGSSLVSVAEIAAWTGRSRVTTRKLISGLDYITNGRDKLYLADDVATLIISMKTQ